MKITKKEASLYQEPLLILSSRLFYLLITLISSVQLNVMAASNYHSEE